VRSLIKGEEKEGERGGGGGDLVHGRKSANLLRTLKKGEREKGKKGKIKMESSQKKRSAQR